MIDIDSLPSHQLSAIPAWERIVGRKFDSIRDEYPVFTYAVTDGEYIKVGRADHIVRRIRSLRTGNPRPLTLLGFVVGDIESRAHRLLKEARQHVALEWFQHNQETLEVLRSLKLCTSPGLSPAVEEHW